MRRFPYNNLNIFSSHLLTASKYEKRLLKNLIRQIDNETPFDAIGFFNIELSTFTSIISTFLTYLIILVQFKDSPSSEFEKDSSSNSTAYANWRI